MRQHAAMFLVAMTLMIVIGIAGSVFSEDTAVKAPGQHTGTMTDHACAATCAKFVDGNKDGVCDSSAVHHANGKCANMAQCKKDGKCPGSCANHAGMMGAATVKPAATPAGCDPTKCLTKTGGCPMKAKAKSPSAAAACPGSK